jgi:hypothetical protein
VIEQVFLDRVAVETGGGAQPARDRRLCLAFCFQVAGIALDVGPLRGEQVQPMSCASRRVLAQVEGVCGAGLAGIVG